MTSGRIIFDISASMRWFGPPRGIERVERQFALWAHANIANVVFVFFDPIQHAYRVVRGDVRPFLTGEAAIDTFGLPEAYAPRGSRWNRIVASVRRALLRTRS